jgi:integrase
MSKHKITKQFLGSLTNKSGKDVFHRDTQLPGFGVKITPKGTISFIAEARIKKGKPKRVTLGKHPILSLDKAREKARGALMLLKQGLDPIELDEQERQQRIKNAALKDSLAITLKTILDEYLELRNLKPGTEKDYRNTFDNCISDWLDEPVLNISRSKIEKRFREIQSKRRRSKRKSDTGKAQAAKCMRILSAVLNHAKAHEVEEGVRLITENPCDVLKEKRVDRRIKPRERYLDKKELQKVVEELEHANHPQYRDQKIRLTSTTVADLLLLLLFTGLRRNEAASLEWEDVNMEGRLFVVHDTKNHSDHVVPMSAQIETMFGRRWEEKEEDERWVFPASKGDGHIIDPRKQIEILTEITGVKFSIHDLRRTFATLAESYGLDYQTIKRALNHKTQDITALYIQTRADKMRHAFDAIASEIMWWVYEEPKGEDVDQNHIDEFDDLTDFDPPVSDATQS